MPKKLKFPDGFLWGAATAAHQVEGNTRNNWSRWEPAVAEELAEGAEERLKNEVPRWDLIKDEATNPENYVSGQAADHYNRYEEDFDILQELNLNAYRFSIEWSRVEPEKGQFSEEALDHYEAVVDALLARDIEPFVSLHHFTNPIWLDQDGGWHNPEVAERFARFASMVSERLGDKVTYWITVNEPGSYLLMRYLGGGIWPQWPQLDNSPVKAYKYLRNVAKAHNAASQNIKQHNSEAKMAMVHGMVDFEAVRKDPFTLLQKQISEYIPDEYLINKIEDNLDWIGVNYYVHMLVESKLASIREWVQERDGEPVNDMGWGVYPEGMYNVTQRLKKYDLPMFITENGIPDKRDVLREQFIKNHLHWLHKSIQDGADIRGYLYWSLLDNFEWSEGFWPEFGLVNVNRDTMERTVRPSAEAYSSIAKNNGFTVSS